MLTQKNTGNLYLLILKHNVGIWWLKIGTPAKLALIFTNYKVAIV